MSNFRVTNYHRNSWMFNLAMLSNLAGGQTLNFILHVKETNYLIKMTCLDSFKKISELLMSHLCVWVYKLTLLTLQKENSSVSLSIHTFKLKLLEELLTCFVLVNLIGFEIKLLVKKKTGLKRSTEKLSLYCKINSNHNRSKEPVETMWRLNVSAK